MTRLHAVGDSEPNPPGRPSGTDFDPAESFDPWETEKGHEYNEDQFYTRSTNKHDHSIDIRFRFPPNLGGAVAEIVTSKRFPHLRSTADFYRDAAVHRLHHLNEMLRDGKVQEGLNIEMRLARLEQKRNEIAEMQLIVASHTSTLVEAKQTGDWRVLSEVIAFVEDDIETVREPYRSQLDALVKEYGRVLQDHHDGKQ